MVAEKPDVKTRLALGLAAVLAILAVVYAVLGKPETEETPEVPPSVWSVEMLELARITISLPLVGKEESWAKHEDKHWYFEEQGGPEVSRERWGGGIPLILSGPRASRIIAADSTDETLERYGLRNPRMRIHLTMESGEIIEAEVGDPTPASQGYYIRRSGSRDVYSVDHTWYEVLERLVLEPPYPGPD